VVTAAVLSGVGLSRHNLNSRITIMASDRIAVPALLEKGPDATFQRELIGFAAKHLIALETEMVHGASPTAPTGTMATVTVTGPPPIIVVSEAERTFAIRRSTCSASGGFGQSPT
jgi:hypothetical protein